MEVIIRELNILKQSVVRYGIVLVLAIIFLLSCTVEQHSWWGVTLKVPLPGSPSLATQFFLASQQLLIPPQVPVVALGPVVVFFAPFLMAMMIAVMGTFPYAVYLIVRFLRPALRPKEYSLLLATVIPALGLFYLGCALAYFLIIPKTFEVLYGFAEPMGVKPFFALDQFISSVFLMTLGVGVSFLFPIVMVLLSRLGLVTSRFWSTHWRGALLSILIFSAVITPDGSGLTMILLSLPLVVLYGAGCLIAERKTRSHAVTNP